MSIYLKIVENSEIMCDLNCCALYYSEWNNQGKHWTLWTQKYKQKFVNKSTEIFFEIIKMFSINRF